MTNTGQSLLTANGVQTQGNAPSVLVNAVSMVKTVMSVAPLGSAITARNRNYEKTYYVILCVCRVCICFLGNDIDVPDTSA